MSINNLCVRVEFENVNSRKDSIVVGFRRKVELSTKRKRKGERRKDGDDEHFGQ